MGSSKNKEVEIKFLVADVRALQRKLCAAGFRLVTPRTHEMNVLYDAPDQRLRAGGQLLRIRKYGKTWTVTHKAPPAVAARKGGASGAPPRHKSRAEIETEVADGAQLDRIFHALGFAPTFRYEKFRSEWTDGKGHVVVDETPIGNVAEIEGPPRWIDQTAKTLGVSRADYITKNYAQMFSEWKQRTGSAASEMTFAAVK